MSPVEMEVIKRKRLAPSSGLRNRLVHEYDRLEHSLVLEAVGTADHLYTKYVKQVNDYVSKIS